MYTICRWGSLNAGPDILCTPTCDQVYLSVGIVIVADVESAGQTGMYIRLIISSQESRYFEAIGSLTELGLHAVIAREHKAISKVVHWLS